MYQAIGKRVKRAFRQDSIMDILLDAVNAGPFDGGCLIVAKALQRILPECKIGTMLRRAEDADVADHFVLLCPDGGVMDADGWARDEGFFIRRYMRNENIKTPFEDFKIEPSLVRGADSPTPDDPRAIKDLEREIRVFFSEH